MNGKVKTSGMSKMKRYMLIGLAAGTFFTVASTCDDTNDAQSGAYDLIQSTQNEIKDAGQAVKNSDLNESLTFEEIWEAIP